MPREKPAFTEVQAVAHLRANQFRKLRRCKTDRQNFGIAKETLRRSKVLRVYFGSRFPLRKGER